MLDFLLFCLKIKYIWKYDVNGWMFFEIIKYSKKCKYRGNISVLIINYVEIIVLVWWFDYFNIWNIYIFCFFKDF